MIQGSDSEDDSDSDEGPVTVSPGSAFHLEKGNATAYCPGIYSLYILIPDTAVDSEFQTHV